MHVTMYVSIDFSSPRSYLHTKTGANLLLNSSGVMKLADFGASKKFDMDSLVSGLKGTPHWMAPEVIKGTQMTDGWQKADIWSVGCTLVEILTAKIPYSCYDNPMTAMYHIANGQIPPIPEDISVSEHAEDFINKCCTLEPSVSYMIHLT